MVIYDIGKFFFCECFGVIEVDLVCLEEVCLKNLLCLYLVVCIYLVIGCKGLFVSDGFIICINELELVESDVLLKFFFVYVM